MRWHRPNCLIRCWSSAFPGGVCSRPAMKTSRCLSLSSLCSSRSLSILLALVLQSPSPASSRFAFRVLSISPSPADQALIGKSRQPVCFLFYRDVGVDAHDYLLALHHTIGFFVAVRGRHNQGLAACRPFGLIVHWQPNYQFIAFNLAEKAIFSPSLRC